jgi:hypothetical protein
MTKSIIIIVLLFIAFICKAQDSLPKGFPVQKWNGRIEATYVQEDSGHIPSLRDTLWQPRFLGTQVVWFHTGVDTAMWIYTGSPIGAKWVRQFGFPSGGGSSNTIITVPNIAALQLQTGADGQIAITQGFYNPSDGGGSIFYRNASSLQDTVTGMIVKSTPLDTGRWINLIDRGSRINVKQFGAIGDSVHDDQPILQVAVDYLESLGGGTMYFPKGNYHVRLPVFLRKNMHWVGDGTTSYVFNDRDTQHSVRNGDVYVYFMGNFNVTTYGSTLHYTSSDTLIAAKNKIQLTSAETDSFHIGGLIEIESPTGFNGSGGFFRPYYAVINRVTEIDRAAGTITIEHPMDTTLPVANIGICDKIAVGSDTDVLGQRYYIADRCSLDNMSFSSADYVARRYGAYECNITNNRYHSSKGVGGNGLSWCNFLNNYLEFTYKAIEYAMYSSNTHIDHNTFVYYNGFDDGVIERPGIKFGENVRNSTVSYNTFIFGDAYTTGPVISFDHAFDNEVVGNKIYAQHINQNVFDVRATNDSVRIFGNLCLNNEAWADSVFTFINLTRSCTACCVDNNRFIGNIFHGTPLQHAYYQGGSNNIIWNNSVDAGDVKIDSDANNFMVNTMGANGRVPQIMLPLKQFTASPISGAIERDATNLYFVDSSKIRHKIEYGDTAINVGDSDYSAHRTDRILVVNAHTASRQIHLVVAPLVQSGTRLLVADFSGNASDVAPIIIVHAGSNTINGVAGNVKITQPYGWVSLTSDGISQWNFDAGKGYAIFAQHPIIYTGTAPSISVGVGAGSGFAATLTGSDGAGTISITTGTGCTAGGNIITVTFNTPLLYNAIVNLTAQSQAAGQEISKFFIDPAGTSATQFRIKNTGTALLDNVLYTLNYTVSQQTP